MTAIRKARPQRREPLLFAPTPKPTRTPPAMPTGPERLLAGGFVPAPPRYKRLHSVMSGMIRPQIMEDQGITGLLALSTALHIILLTFLLWESARAPHGTPMGEQAQPVEMMFDAPPSKSGMQGPRSKDQGGGSNAPKQSQATQSQDQAQSDSTPTPAAPTPETPASPPVPQAPAADLPTPTPTPAPPNPATAPSGHSSQPSPHAHHSSHRHASAQSSNPFANMMDLSFDQNPGPRRTRHGRYGGSGGPIDMSVGPLVKNGQINAPYMTRNSIHGVSEDYSGELDRWIRAHMYYPEDAAQNGEEGPSSVHVVLDRSGHVRSVRITGQSGSYSLDAATSGMFRGATLPPVPPDMSGDHFDIDLTINYILIRR